MFTGIVETIGGISGIDITKAVYTFIIEPDDRDFLSDAKKGDSIAVNGTCLTITEIHTADRNPSIHTKPQFVVTVAPETLRRTNLGELEKESLVNLEAACKPSTRLGGHYVQGHVDTTAKITSTRLDGEAKVFRFKPKNPDLLRYVVEKGYVTIDGASLTVTAVGWDWFEVMLIPFTQEKIVTSRKEMGEDVNLEVDIMLKHAGGMIERYLEENLERLPGLERLVERIVEKKLGERGRG